MRHQLTALLLIVSPAAAQELRPLPETHVLALARAPDSSIWVGTYGAGIYVLRPGASQWEHITRATDTAAHPARRHTAAGHGSLPAASQLVHSADRPRGPAVHRPDLPLRFDHGRQLPAASGSR